MPSPDQALGVQVQAPLLYLLPGVLVRHIRDEVSVDLGDDVLPYLLVSPQVEGEALVDHQVK